MNEGAVINAADSLLDDWYYIHNKSCTSFGQLAALVHISAFSIIPAAIKYNRIVSVEFFLNLVWLLLSASLATLWIRESHLAPVRSDQLNTKTQLLALTMLIVILLPVISMTDDVQAMSTAEIEHVTRRVDLLPNSDQPADIAVPLNTTLLSYVDLFDAQAYAPIEPLIKNLRPQSGSIRQIANRPPPQAA